MKLKEALTEYKSTELVRIKKLFIRGYRSYLSTKPRLDRLEFILDILSEILPEKSDLKLLMVALNRRYSQKKTKDKDKDKK